MIYGTLRLGTFLPGPFRIRFDAPNQIEITGRRGSDPNTWEPAGPALHALFAYIQRKNKDSDFTHTLSGRSTNGLSYSWKPDQEPIS